MTNDKFSCFLIGADTLLVECGEVLLQRGHRICGVVTATPRIRAWAAEKGVAVVDPAGGYKAALAEEPFDYLFAITHLSIIPDDVLELPAKAAINFHDGPLPRYAGLNAPVWALMNRESSYGVSWHLMTSGVDEGDLLKQTEFEIAPQETALSINTKCMASALESFPELVDELAAGTTTRTPQDSSERTYFGRYDRPAAAGLVDWSKTSEEVEAFVRALTFGPYPNPIGVPLGSRSEAHAEPFVLSEVRIGGAVDGEPGTVAEVREDAVVVATADGSIEIRGGHCLQGSELSPATIAVRYGLSAGVALDSAHTDFGSELTKLDEVISRAERFFEKRLREAEGTEVPQAASERGEDAVWSSASLDVPGGLTHAAVAAAWSGYLARTGRKEAFQLSYPAKGGVEGWTADTVPLRVELEAGRAFTDVVSDFEIEFETLSGKGCFWRALITREPAMVDRRLWGTEGVLPVGFSVDMGVSVGTLLSLDVSEDSTSATLHYDGSRIDEAAAGAMVAGLKASLAAATSIGEGAWSDLPIVDQGEADRLLKEWNETEADYPSDRCIHQLFEDQVDRTPDKTALVYERGKLTYRELDERANALAGHLRTLGVGPDSLVGVHVPRSLDLMVATLGVMKAGGAYVPLDPDFPADRIALMIEDSGTKVIVSHSSIESDLPEHDAQLVVIDTDAAIASASTERPDASAGADNLAYAIYTSGSTGRPKGVLVEHRNVTNFFTGMDAVVQHDPPGVWLAVTSLSFDISVLELFWTLARGFEVVIYADHAPSAEAGETFDASVTSRPIDFGLFMWGNDDGPGRAKYRLMLEGAKYFDQNGFHSVWTPERHFGAFGGPFPNPSVTGAALAAITENVSIRSGSCVSPLHHPIRIAEEWAVIDNLSDGRVGLSFAAGWQPNDFIIRPDAYGRQKEVMMEQIDEVRRLWRGEYVKYTNPMGQEVEIHTLPRPVQEELPFWVTTAGNPDTYRAAGAMGANVLTHLLGQSLEEVAGKIEIYRQARADAGLDPAGGQVTLMLHTFVGDDDEEVREIVRQPMKDYLGASMKLVLGFAWTFPAFKRPGGDAAEPQDIDLSTLTDEENDAILEFAFERYYETSGLFGSVDTCVEMVNKCKAIGVDEIACLLDYGVDTDAALDSLPLLKQVRDATARPDATAAAPAEPKERLTFADQVEINEVTHLQCTPSMARLILADPEASPGLSRIEHLMIGGEAFPPALAADLSKATSGTITNMYGPTETTIWSSTQRVEGAPESIPIGRPIANTQIYVLDRYKGLLPAGVPGDLYIGGDGVTRGYHERPDLTAERFVADPFGTNGDRMYWTGDLARYRSDGVIDFLGRVDHQVKYRGYRIELGEIESAVDQHENVRMSAVLLREDQPGNQQIVAYMVPDGEAPEDRAMRTFLRESLPEYMVPGVFVVLDHMPLTPNGKIDRKALPAPQAARTTARADFVEPGSELEKKIAACWQQTLQVERVGVEDNFFDIGGHSLLVVQLHRALTAEIEQKVSLVDLYRFPTIRSLTDHLSDEGDDAGMQDSIDRAQRRREAMAGRRRRRN